MNRIANATIALMLAVGSLAALAVPPAMAQGNYAIEQRFQDMERLITQLTGQVERLQNQVQQLQEKLDRQQADYDFRIQQLESGRGGARPPAPRPTPGPRGDATPPPAPMTPGGLSPGQQADTRPLGSTPSSGPPPAPPPPAAGPEHLYNEAMIAMRSGEYAVAEREFRNFLAKNPRHQLAGNAQYWLGETYYVRKDYANAATAYANGFKTYRTSSVGPDNLLKLGMSLQASGKSADACIVYGQFNQVYPQATDALKRRIAAERQRSRC
ncbi:tol-pal system protein YbgF [Vineibacter terrae]|uniref:Cell division coordinator CpoB n=1 Tax=Vineibacter terrae TaxID=2586908 RepID=A0A5C8P9D9_9HYPH|nr:tol-pal system protein YbgF [Vineibacter terrae]TXL70383.1 tol-pal system protein YbgF [Vineibacter terrae]